VAIEWLDSFNGAVSLLRGAVGLVRDVQDTLPEGTRRAVNQALDEADKATQLAEAQIAKGLGYQLCQCDFPPKIMLFAGYDEQATSFDDAGFVRCPACGHEEPPARLRRRGRAPIVDFG